MLHDDICITIKELHEQVESIRSELNQNTGIAGSRGSGGEPIDPESGARSMKAMEQIRKLKPKLVEALNALGRAYQQKGNEDMARFYFNQAKRY